MGYLFAGLLFVLIVVFVVMSWKQWHWSFSIFLILSFFAGLAATSAAAKVFKLRSTALRELEQSESALTKAKDEAERFLYGDPRAVTYSADSFYGIESKFKLITTGRGRVWSHGLVDAGTGNRVFRFASAGGGGVADNSSLKGTVLYAFVDFDMDGKAVPSEFLGSVTVVNVQAESLELAPLFIVDAEAFQGAGSWTLYEKMPGDRHDTFILANNLAQDMSDLAKDLSITNYRRLLTEEIFPASFVGMEENSEQYEAFIDQFAFDYRPLGEIRNWVEANAETRFKKTFQPVPEEEFVLVEFEANASRAYRVDAPGNMNIDGPFTLQGEAIDRSLHLGKEVAFRRGQKVLVNRYAFDGYQRADGTQIPRFEEGKVKVIDTIYRRQLYDFPGLVSDYRRQTKSYTRTATEIERTLADSRATLKLSEEQRDRREDMLFKLREDQRNLNNDLQVITTLAESRKDELQAMQDRIEALEQRLSVIQQRVREGTGGLD
jgi:hypothetical protein